MKFFLLFFLTIGSISYAQEQFFFDDTIENQRYRLSVANANLEAVRETISYIQMILNKEPERASDLICVSMKYLNCAMDCLNDNDVKYLNFYKEK